VLALDEDGPQDLWEDIEEAKKINGTFANRIFVQPLGNGMVRINFGEVLDEFPSYHTAIVVRADQAAGFAQVIYNISTGVIEAEQQAAEAASNLKKAAAAVMEPGAPHGS